MSPVVRCVNQLIIALFVAWRTLESTRQVVCVRVRSARTQALSCSVDLNVTWHIELTRSINMAELRKLRRQFISYTKMHPTENTGQLCNMFVQYLQKSLC